MRRRCGIMKMGKKAKKKTLSTIYDRAKIVL